MYQVDSESNGHKCLWYANFGNSAVLYGIQQKREQSMFGHVMHWAMFCIAQHAEICIFQL